jgi:hypothetical protein
MEPSAKRMRARNRSTPWIGKYAALRCESITKAILFAGVAAKNFAAANFRFAEDVVFMLMVGPAFASKPFYPASFGVMPAALSIEHESRSHGVSGVSISVCPAKTVLKT